MKNSIEENIKEIECFFKRNYFVNYDWTIIHRNSMANLEDSIEHILSDYKRVLKENESLQKTYDDCYCKYKHYKQFESISIQKVKDKIEELDNKRRKFTSDNVNNFYLQEFTRKYTQKSDHDYGVFSTPETITYCTNNELLGRVEVLQELLREE